MSEMIDRLAVVLDPIAMEGCGEQGCEYCNCARTKLRKKAAGLIGAMREPTPKMIQAGSIGSGEDSNAVALGAWQAMVDEALK